MTGILRRSQAKPEALRGHLVAASQEPMEVAELPAVVNSPRVSVVLCTYNRRGLALDALVPLSRQQSSPFEVVVVDDGSTDGSFEAIVKRGTDLGLAGRVIRLHRNRGLPTARNVGVLGARSELIACTDDDCLATPGWIEAGLASFRSGIGVVQGCTQPPPGARPPLFSHFIQVEGLDGSFSTCNAFYRREAVLEARGFDPSCHYWEDRDLGARVLRQGWKASYAPDAIVYHQIIPQSPLEWMRWPAKVANWPRWVARYPECRRYLFARYWASPVHAALTAALAGLLLAPAYPPAVLLTLPYVVGFLKRYRFQGRWRLLKAALHLWWDLLGWTCLAVNSIRQRTLVL